MIRILVRVTSRLICLLRFAFIFILLTTSIVGIAVAIIIVIVIVVIVIIVRPLVKCVHAAQRALTVGLCACGRR